MRIYESRLQAVSLRPRFEEDSNGRAAVTCLQAMVYVTYIRLSPFEHIDLMIETKRTFVTR